MRQSVSDLFYLAILFKRRN